MEKKAAEGINPPSDEMGIAKAFMDLSSRLLANPYKLAPDPDEHDVDYFSCGRAPCSR